jgi:hypothetical protein
MFDAQSNLAKYNMRGQEEDCFDEYRIIVAWAADRPSRRHHRRWTRHWPSRGP